eukprot:6487767-Amphidinium_carterae.1
MRTFAPPDKSKKIGGSKRNELQSGQLSSNHAMIIIAPCKDYVWVGGGLTLLPSMAIRDHGLKKALIKASH